MAKVIAIYPVPPACELRIPEPQKLEYEAKRKGGDFDGNDLQEGKNLLDQVLSPR